VHLVADLGKRTTSISVDTKTGTVNMTEKSMKDTTGISLQPKEGLGPSGSTETGKTATSGGTIDTTTVHGSTTETPNTYRTAVVFTVIGMSTIATSPAPKPAPPRKPRGPKPIDIYFQEPGNNYRKGNSTPWR
jgi:hypothetical protein